jgi:UDP-glucose 4-epimerase
VTRSLVTGGCGFVGRQLVRRLLGMAHEVWIIDDLSTGLPPEAWLQRAGQKSVKFIHENLAGTMLKQLGWIDSGEKVKFPAFDYVFALASIVGGRMKIDHDPLAVGVDLALDALFFQWLARNKDRIGRVLYASSSAAYPTNLQTGDGHVALREEMIDFASGKLGQPDMTYGWSKLTGEYLSRLAASHYGISVACVRPFSGYGEDQDLSYPVPAIALRVARGDDPVTVWGTGEQGRDFVHVEDCITAMLLAVDRIGDGSGVNIGTGRLTTFLQVAALFLRLDGRSAAIQPLLDKPAGVQSRYCDPSQMHSILGWKPSISLKEGFGRVLEAARERVASASPRFAAAGAE